MIALELKAKDENYSVYVGESSYENLQTFEKEEGIVDAIYTDSDEDGGLWGLTAPIGDLFKTPEKLINYCIESGIIPSYNYIIVSQEGFKTVA